MGQSFPKIKIIAVGKVKKPWLQTGIATYVKRLPEIEIVEIKDAGKEKEADKLESLIKPQDRLVVLSEQGETKDSIAFSSWLANEAFGTLVLFIGGPEGICDRLKAHPMICLSAMTFPHEIARLMLVEQLYRAKTILQNGSYHK
ncbi:MAG: 23S rRNA (pseudouridine1915-N3)-methyltransferase RlmH [Phormidesmis priestleyi Ana]|uniref:Ribosomal RNA large subunit methyltransferase H n=1 Tax=Phormidesmis priestleyi Ana TaxID=1666911 RepID=A0A0P8C2N5_9CYAN|nr:MAG: 23S rRNA (pseudouridine1915-N3)-methyltransferase RlmH [Phormidesmis priestleyi Ana]